MTLQTLPFLVFHSFCWISFHSAWQCADAPLRLPEHDFGDPFFFFFGKNPWREGLTPTSCREEFSLCEVLLCWDENIQQFSVHKNDFIEKTFISSNKEETGSIRCELIEFKFHESKTNYVIYELASLEVNCSVFTESILIQNLPNISWFSSYTFL